MDMRRNEIPTVEELLADIRSLTKEQQEEVNRFIKELSEKRQRHAPARKEGR